MNPTLRFWLLLAAGLALLVGATQLLEGFMPPGSGAGLEIDVDRLRPRVSLDDRTIRIETGFMQVSRFNFHPDKPEAEIQAIFECLDQGVLEVFGPLKGTGETMQLNTAALRASAEKTEEGMDRIRRRCIPID